MIEAPENYLSTSRLTRPRTPLQRILMQWLWLLIDIVVIFCSIILVSILLGRSLHLEQWIVLLIMTTIQISVHIHRGLYKTVLRYVSFRELTTIVSGVLLGVMTVVLGCYFLDRQNTGGLGRVFIVLHTFGTVTLCMGTRVLYRLASDNRTNVNAKRVIIFGSGSLGEITLRELKNIPNHKVIGFLDSMTGHHGEYIRGYRVFGNLDLLPSLHHKHGIDLLIIAERMLSQHALKKAFQMSMELGIQVKHVHGIGLRGTNLVHLQDLALEDLLRRPQRNLDRDALETLLKDRTVLITGAGGSIGSELCNQIARAGATHLILLDHSEFNLYQINDRLSVLFPRITLTARLATLTDYKALDNIIANHQPNIVFHAAAYKHVPLVEENPFLGMSNNVGGFWNLLQICIAREVPQLIAISSDKAVRPTNIMGASKRICELILQNIDAKKTRLCAVRFGNVLGSSGSVIPHFLEQIRRGGPVTVTHPDVTRYFMLLPEAVELVLHAGAIAKHGDILILDMGDPIKIVNLARQLIYMTGNRPDIDIRIAFTGLRPGEKLTEELLLDDSEASTNIDGITIASPTKRNQQEIIDLIERLLLACQDRELGHFIHLTQYLVPEWKPSNEFSELINGNTDQYANRKIKNIT